MDSIDLAFQYTPAQAKVFFESKARRRVIHKGRRLGFTRGCAQFVIETALGGPHAFLWGDTIALNIRNYFERYFLPVLKQLPETLWSWKSTDKVLKIGESVVDFRSADQPENWEGFGYDYVILNEAGIILKNRYLWENAVAPMLLDNPDAVAIIGGTPKGKGLFYELAARGGVMEGWETFQFSTYDNPFLTDESIKVLERELGEGSILRQEIYGDFLDVTSNGLYDFGAAQQAMDREGAPEDAGLIEVWGLDIARQGSDESVLARRRDNNIYDIKPFRLDNLMVLAESVVDMYRMASRKPDAIFVEINGLGAGVYDRMTQLGVPCIPADVSMSPLDEQILNKRSEMHKVFADAIKRQDFKCVKDGRLLAELGAIEYEYTNGEKWKLVSKKNIRALLGFSPDRADACALTFFAPVIPKDVVAERDEDMSFMGSW